MPGSSVLCKHRFVVVVEERIGEPGFDDRPGGFGLLTLEAMAAHLVRLPPVVADELEALVQDILGVMRTMKSQGLKTSKLRPIFGFIP